MKDKPVYFEGINALRFFAAFAIIVFHSTQNLQDKFPNSIKMFVHNLPIGVDLFFLISGFLIVYLLLLEKQSTQGILLDKFYIRRILRIFPLYFFIVLIAFVRHHKPQAEVDFSQFLFFAGNFWMIKTNSWTMSELNPLWSLCIEEHFYLIVPFLLVLIPIDKVKFLFLSVIVISLIYRLYVSVFLEFNWMNIYCHSLSRCDMIAIGGLIAYYHYMGKIRLNIKLSWVLAGLIYLSLLMMVVDYNDYTSLNYALFKKYLFTGPLIFLFSGIILNTNTGKLFISFKHNRPLNYLGKISFGLYMYHSLMIELVNTIQFINHSWVLTILVVTIFTIILATISFEFFEKQFLKLNHKWKLNREEVELNPLVNPI